MRRVTASNGVGYEYSELLPCPHAFATRIGGVSRLPHTAALNLGFGRGDPDETVLANLALFGEAVGFDAHRVISAEQIHSAKVRRVDKSHAGEGYYYGTTEPADGYLTTDDGIVLGVRTADCVPVLLYGQGERSGACIAAVHAGWRGTLAGISAVAVGQMKGLGVAPETIRAAIGPSIGACCYEVGEKFFHSFADKLGENVAAELIRPSGNDGKWHADLKEINRRLLLDARVLPENVDVSDSCTACLPEVFFSHRKSGGKRGTMLSVIFLREKKSLAPDGEASGKLEV